MANLKAKLEAVRELLEWSKNAEKEGLKKRKKKKLPAEEAAGDGEEEAAEEAEG